VWLIDFQRARIAKHLSEYNKDWIQLIQLLHDMAEQLGTIVTLEKLREWTTDIPDKKGL
jgi:hypothetical protein